MNRNNSPGVGQWITVTLLVAVSMFLLVKLYQYSGMRSFLPTGLTIGGVDVSRLDEDAAMAKLAENYIESPIRVYHGDDSFDISPLEAEFTLDSGHHVGSGRFSTHQAGFLVGVLGLSLGPSR